MEVPQNFTSKKMHTAQENIYYQHGTMVRLALNHIHSDKQQQNPN